MFKKIALAIAFSPRTEQLLSEARRLVLLYQSEIIFIHVGEHSGKEEENIRAMIESAGFEGDYQLAWEKGDPVKKILAICHREKVDLLIAGALKKENLYNYYIGSIARKILRRAECSVLVLTDPKQAPAKFKRIIVSGNDNPNSEKALASACDLAIREKTSQLHVVRETKLYGLAMSISESNSEEEYTKARRNYIQDEIGKAHRKLAKINTEGLSPHVKVTTGKAGFEIAKYTKKVKGDLLIIGGAEKELGFIDFFFPNDLEYIFANLPSNVLIIHQ